MPPPVWVPGQVLASADINSWFVPLVAVKGSDQSVTSSTTLVNDTALLLSLAANATYYFRLDLQIVANDTAQFKSQFTGPAGASMAASMLGFNTGATFGMTTRSLAATVVFTGNAAAVVPFFWWGNVTTVGTAGSFQYQWAQNTSNGTACTVKAGSQLLAWRVT
jgi:hypothetical protein